MVCEDTVEDWRGDQTSEKTCEEKGGTDEAGGFIRVSNRGLDVSVSLCSREARVTYKLEKGG